MLAVDEAMAAFGTGQAVFIGGAVLGSLFGLTGAAHDLGIVPFATGGRVGDFDAIAVGKGAGALVVTAAFADE